MDDRKGVHVKLLVLLLLLNVSLIIQLVSVSATGTTEDEEIMCLEKERQALLGFKEGLTTVYLYNDYDVLASWGGEEDKKECCKWEGITCSNTTHHVVALLVQSSYLSGVVFSQLGNLTKLKTFSLQGSYGLHVNSLHGLDHLSSLSHLDLAYTNINDTNWLHVISSLPSLKELNLDHCSLPQLTLSSMGFSVNTSFPSLARVALTNTNQVNWLLLSWLLNMTTSLVSIDLSDNQIGGSIPEAFGNFVFLEHLYLSGNALAGGIPSTFRNLSNLVYLDLSRNQMTFFPVLGWLFSLRELHLSENKLNGLAHPNFWKHEKLEILDVSYNMLKGNISESHLSNLPNLKELSFSFNSIALNSITTGWVPPFQLDVLKLSHCEIGPRFPKWIQTQTNISHLDLSSGGISDYVPEWFGDLSPRLTILNLSHNHFSGSFPDLFLKVVGYPQIDVSYNNFSGFLPVFHPNSTMLQLSRNRFKGSISASLCTNDRLGVLDLSYNQLSGELPDCLMNSQVWILNLSNNSFSGKIPCVGNGLVALFLRNNDFSGEIPSCLMFGRGLEMIDVGGNRLTGTIPTWLGTNLIHLKYLSLRGNEFHGMIPLELCHLSEIQVLDLSMNNISGRIPHCFSNFTSLAEYDSMGVPFLGVIWVSYADGIYYPLLRDIQNVYITWKSTVREYKLSNLSPKLIDLSSNTLKGNIPEEFSFMQGLISLNLSRNHLTGKIDSHIGQMKMLECLDFSRNELSGEIPTGLAQLNFLAVLDLSSNNLSGHIPSSTQLQTFEASTYAGNDGLCGPPLAPCPVAADSPPMSLTKNVKHKHLDVGLYISVASGLVLGFWGAVGVSFFPSLRRNALFNFWNKVWNWVYVTTIVYVRRMRG